MSDRPRIAFIDGMTNSARMVALALSQMDLAPIIISDARFSDYTAPSQPDPFDLPPIFEPRYSPCTTVNMRLGRADDEWSERAHLRTPARDIEHFETPAPLSKRARRRLKGRKT